ncbi:MAG TPA: hypothetical protein PKE64_29875, partial [Anaerolineae bacterium]|nr:hypothetical protein [Anaerolineae bacterium]
MARHRKRDFSPLVVLSGLTLAAFLIFMIPGEELLSMSVYVGLGLFFASLLYVKGIKPVDPDFPPSLFWWAFVLKLLSSAVNYWFVAEVYGRGDANRYHTYGIYVAQYLANFDFSILQDFGYGSQYTTNMVFLTGLFYTILPASLSGIFFLFAGLAFMGSMFFYRAFRLAFSTSSPHLFRFGIFFLPSILYWPSSLGKDAWIFCFSGLIAYGFATYLRQARLSGLLLVGVGLFLISLIRPHITFFIGLAIMGAFFYYLLGSKAVARRTEALIIGGVLIIGLTFFALRTGFDFFGLERFEQEEVEAFYDDIQDRYTGSTGSSFRTASIFEPTGAIQGIITVLFRPFPWEAHNIPALITSIESVLVVVLLWSRRRLFWSRVVHFRSDPWIIFIILTSII